MGHATQFAVAATKLTLADAGLNSVWDNPYAVGIVIGTSMGNLEDGLKQEAILLERGAARVNPFISFSLETGSIVVEVAVEAHAQGPAFTVSGGCASSLCALGVASDLVRGGSVDVCLSGGAESPIFPLALVSISKTQGLATLSNDPPRACCPFDRRHDGIVLSEGGCVLVLEEMGHAKRRQAPIYGEIVSYALGCEAYDLFNIEPSGENAAHILQQALERAAITPADIDCVNAHGSSYPDWDRKETRVLKRALGEAAYSIPISATKSVMGHTVGAAAAFQVASAFLSLNHQLLPPTINLQEPDPECDLDYVPNLPRPATSCICLVNSFGHGGINSFMVLKGYP
jgi:3-oxoacyl-[acyl-carrier-protein] synthase II